MLTLWRMCWVTSSWIGQGWPPTGPLTLQDSLPLVPPVSTLAPWRRPPHQEHHAGKPGVLGGCEDDSAVTQRLTDKTIQANSNLRLRKHPWGKMEESTEQIIRGVDQKTVTDVFAESWLHGTVSNVGYEAFLNYIFEQLQMCPRPPDIQGAPKPRFPVCFLIIWLL